MSPELQLIWSRKLPRPMYLDDGRTIGTLAAARDFVLGLPMPQRGREHWQQAAEVLLKAAYRGEQDSVQDAGAKLSRALEIDGMI